MGSFIGSPWPLAYRLAPLTIVAKRPRPQAKNQLKSSIHMNLEMRAVTMEDRQHAIDWWVNMLAAMILGQSEACACMCYFSIG